MKLATAAQMKRMDDIAIRERGIPSTLLMERAAFEAEIGINPVTVLVTTILGIPGLAMLYGIKIVSLL